MTLQEALDNQKLWGYNTNLREQIIQDLENSKVAVDEATGLKITKKKDSYAIEEAIMDCWNILEDLKLIQEYAGTERIPAMLDGIDLIYGLKFDKLWKAFENN